MLDLQSRSTTEARQSVLALDGDLCPGLVGSRRGEAERRATAPVYELPPGRLDCEAALAEGERGFGLLALSGLLCRHVGRERRAAAELIGPGDVFRPWDQPGRWASIPADCNWNVLMPSRIAVLDREFAARAGAFPEIAIALHKRALERATRLATLMCLANYRRVETRLLHLFWQLADRFGSVGREEIRIPLLLTHAVIAEMAALRRPSVTSGLAQLDAAGILRRDDQGWRLLRSSAEQLRSGG